MPAHILSVALPLLVGAVFHSPLPRGGVPNVYQVTKTADTADGSCDLKDCSLREAIIAANAHSGVDTVVLPEAGTPFGITIAGAGEDLAQSGDLDITDDLIIIGAGPELSAIDGDATEQVFHMPLGAGASLVEISAVSLRNGAGEVGAIRQSTSGSTLTLTDVVLSDHPEHALAVSIGRTLNCDRCSFLGRAISVVQGTLNLINSTLHHEGENDVLAFGTDSTVDIQHATIVGDVEVGAASASVVWHNVILDGECVLFGVGAVVSDSGNVESPGDTCNLDPLMDQSNVSSVDLDLGPLQDNGGLTPTMAITTSSAAAFFGATPCAAFDQRGVGRPSASCASGAFEPAVFLDGFESGDTTAWSLTMP